MMFLDYIIRCRCRTAKLGGKKLLVCQCLTGSKRCPECDASVCESCFNFQNCHDCAITADGKGFFCALFFYDHSY